MTRQLVHAIQRYYPQIYLACHVDHVRTKSNEYHLSAHDSMVLTHLDETQSLLSSKNPDDRLRSMPFFVPVREFSWANPFILPTFALRASA